MWELDRKEGWAPKSWCLRFVVLEKTLESPLDCKDIKPVHPKGNQPLIFIERTDVEAEAPILWPPDAKSWIIGKDLDAGKDWRQKEKGMTEDEMVGKHHRVNAHESELTPGDSEGQGSLVCWGSWGCKESDTTWQLNNNKRHRKPVCRATAACPEAGGQGRVYFSYTNHQHSHTCSLQRRSAQVKVYF